MITSPSDGLDLSKIRRAFELRPPTDPYSWALLEECERLQRLALDLISIARGMIPPAKQRLDDRTNLQKLVDLTIAGERGKATIMAVELRKQFERVGV